MPPPLAIFGINGGAASIVVSLLLLSLVAVWVALVFWTYFDARRRVADPLLVGCATAASLFPFIGTVIYTIIRPPEYLEDARERELEIAAAEARLASMDVLACPYCDFDIEKSFLRCPSCLRKLKEPCTSCSRPLDPRWKICPFCETEVVKAAPPRRRQRTGRTSEQPAVPRQTAAPRQPAPPRQPPAQRQAGATRAPDAEPRRARPPAR